MKMTLDPELASEAKALVALAFRNGPIEDICMLEGPVRFAAAIQRSLISPTTR